MDSQRFPVEYYPLAGENSLVRVLDPPEPNLLGMNVYKTMQSEHASFYGDITLICPEGTRISAVRMILAISSSYFEKLLTSEFAEKELSEISINVSSKVLEEILEFIYTDDCPLIRLIRTKNYDRLVLCRTMRDLMDLAFGADYVRMERLVSRCEGALEFLTREYPHLAPIVIQRLRPHHTFWCERVIGFMFDKVISCMTRALLEKFGKCNIGCGVMHLDNEAAEAVFSSLLSRASANTNNSSPRIFLALLLWASGGTAIQVPFPFEVSWEDSQSLLDTEVEILDERLETAKRIARKLDLTGPSIKPKFLSEVVEPSGLIERAAINDAYKNISIRYEEELKREKVQTLNYRNRTNWELQSGYDIPIWASSPVPADSSNLRDLLLGRTAQYSRQAHRRTRRRLRR